MVDTIAKTIVLYDEMDRVIKDLRTGMTARVKIVSTPIYKIQNKDFSSINNKKKKENSNGFMG